MHKNGIINETVPTIILTALEEIVPTLHLNAFLQEQAL